LQATAAARGWERAARADGGGALGAGARQRRASGAGGGGTTGAGLRALQSVGGEGGGVGGEGGGGSGASVRQPDGVAVAPRAQKMAKSRSVEPTEEERGAYIPHPHL
jgi:hypothetical protein